MLIDVKQLLGTDLEKYNKLVSAVIGILLSFADEKHIDKDIFLTVFVQHTIRLLEAYTLNELDFKDAPDVYAWMWHDAEEPPEDDRYILVSFLNFDLPAIAYYRRDEDGGGAYCYDAEEKTLVELGLFVNGWMELPKRKKDD